MSDDVPACDAEAHAVGDHAADTAGGVVRRCVCFDASFETILGVLREGGTLMDAHVKTGFGARCGLCVPYVMRAAQSGQSALPVMWARNFEDLGIPPGAVERLDQPRQAQDDVREA